MRINRRDTENWMAHRMLPKELRQRIRRYDHYKWQLNRGVKEEELISNLPKDLRRDTKHHLYFDLCFTILKKVPLFRNMDNRLLDAMYEYLKPVLFTENSNILQDGDPIDMMIFIVRGRLITRGWDNDSYSILFKAGDFCGEELVQWAMEPDLIPLPISTRTITSLTKVEAFALEANELKSIVIQFQLFRLKSKHPMRSYSPEWRVWAAFKVQEAWHNYRQRKQKRRGGDGRFQSALAKTVGTSTSVGATPYETVFISPLLKAVQRDHQQRDQPFQLSRVMTLPPPPKPDERDKPDHTILDL